MIARLRRMKVVGQVEGDATRREARLDFSLSPGGNQEKLSEPCEVTLSDVVRQIEMIMRDVGQRQLLLLQGLELGRFTILTDSTGKSVTF